MNCLICGSPSVSGVKLCPDCRAARKRAFAATVTQPLFAAAGAAARTSRRLLKPGRPLALAAQRAESRAAVNEAKAAKEVASRAKWSLAVATLAILFIAAGYFTQRGIIAKQVGALTPGAAEAVAREGSGATPKIAGAETKQPAPPSQPATSAGPAPLIADVPVFRPANSALPASIDAPKRPGSRIRPPTPVVAEIAPEPAPVVQPVVPPPPPPVVREAPRPDPWQPLNDALARCPRNDILGRSTCEYRVRSQYCNGHWGEVPQCASMPYIDHGQ